MSVRPFDFKADCTTEALPHTVEFVARAFLLAINVRQDTASQISAILVIADRKSINLVEGLKSRFGVDRPEDIFVGDASRFIDELKAGSQESGAP